MPHHLAVRREARLLGERRDDPDGLCRDSGKSTDTSLVSPATGRPAYGRCRDAVALHEAKAVMGSRAIPMRRQLQRCSWDDRRTRRYGINSRSRHGRQGRRYRGSYRTVGRRARRRTTTSLDVRYIRQLFWVGLAIAGTVALLSVTPKETALAAMPYVLVLAVGLAAWVVYDSHRIGLRQYQTSLGWHPLLVFMLVVLWPIIVFPWDLTVRERVLLGQVPRKPAAPPADIE